MSVRLRLTRQGRKKRPFFRIVAVDSRRRRDGEFLDKIGHYNPLTKPAEVVIDEEKALAWLNKGALPTDTVRSLFSKQGILMKFDLQKKGASPEKISEEMKKRELLQKAREEEAKKSAPKPAPEPEPEVQPEAEPLKAEEPTPAKETAPIEEPAPPAEAAPAEETAPSAKEETPPTEETAPPAEETAASEEAPKVE